MDEIKIILFDVDGVLIRPPFYFSEVLEREGYEGAKKSLNDFFRGKDNNLCLENRARAEEIIRPYLEEIGWRGKPEEYFFRQFTFEKSYLDREIMSVVKEQRERGIGCCLCTDQFASRAKFLLEEMNFRNIFDCCYISCRIGFRKCSEEFWKFPIKDLKNRRPNLETDQIAYFDDNRTNIETASKFGIRSFMFQGMDRFRHDMESLNMGKIENADCQI